MLFASNFYLTFAVSVLALRGSKQTQPFVDDEGNILLYNGEIYEGALEVRLILADFLSNLFLRFQIKPDENDGLILSRHLKCYSTDEQICNLISSLEGCFAFIYFQV